MADTDHEADGARRDAAAALPRDIQEHLGQKLRKEFRVPAEQPSYLGEQTIPPQFEPMIRALRKSQDSEQQGLDAVKRALSEPPEDGEPR